jgi:hypothetical protein
VRLRPRGESHLLAFLAIAAAVCVSIAAVKPWGEHAAAPGPSTMAPSAGTTSAVASDPGQPYILVPPAYVGTGAESCTGNQYWFAVSGSPQPLSSLEQITPLLICASESQQHVVWLSSPGPDASASVELESSTP